MRADYTFADDMLYNKDGDVAVSVLTFKRWKEEVKPFPQYLKLLSWGSSIRNRTICLNVNLNKALLDNNYEDFKRFFYMAFADKEIDDSVCQLYFDNLEVQWVGKYRKFRILYNNKHNYEYIDFFKKEDWLTGNVENN